MMKTDDPARDPPHPRNAWAVVAYPLQPAALTTLAALSLAMLATAAPLLGVVIRGVVWAAAYHYAVEVFERSANGSARAPEFALEQDGIGWTLLILQLLFSVCEWWLQACVDTAELRWLGSGLIAFVQPAMTLSVAMNRDIGTAFDPRRLLGAVSGLGATYLLLVACSSGLGMLQHAVNAILASSRTYVMLFASSIGVGGGPMVQGSVVGGGPILLFAQMLAGFVWFYAVVAYFHLLGRAVFTHADALGYVPVDESPMRPEDRHAPLLKRVEAMVASNDHATAARALRECLASEPHTSPAMHARYRELLARTGDRAGLLEHARMRLDALLVAGDEREALALARESLETDAQFRPGSGERTTQLAQAAMRFGQPELALTLLRDFTQRHPHDMEIPANALLAARILVERHADMGAARDALQAALDRVLPAHPRHDELVEQLATINQLLARMPPGAARNGVDKT